MLYFCVLRQNIMSTSEAFSMIDIYFEEIEKSGECFVRLL